MIVQKYKDMLKGKSVISCLSLRPQGERKSVMRMFLITALAIRPFLHRRNLRM